MRRVGTVENMFEWMAGLLLLERGGNRLYTVHPSLLRRPKRLEQSAESGSGDSHTCNRLQHLPSADDHNMPAVKTSSGAAVACRRIRRMQVCLRHSFATAPRMWISEKVGTNAYWEPSGREYSSRLARVPLVGPHSELRLAQT